MKPSSPASGYVYGQADFPGLELHTLAECCFKWVGFSKLGDALNAGLDAHLQLAGTILELPYSEVKMRYADGDTAVADARHLAKGGNFGLPGGMGADKFLYLIKKTLKPAVFARLKIDRDRIVRLKEEWFETWPEMKHYFRRISDLCGDAGQATVESLYTERTRGGAYYCAAANNGFQALGADCAKNAAWLIAEAQYTQPTSPLWNTRTVAMVHDEFLIEVRNDERAHDAAYELARLMRCGANEFLRHVPFAEGDLKPLLMSPWSKRATQVFDSNGRLVPWAA